MSDRFELKLTPSENGRPQVRIIDRKTAIKEMGSLALATAVLGLFPNSSFAEDTIESAGNKRVRIVGMRHRDLMENFKKDRTCQKMHARMKNRGLRFDRGKGGYLTASWNGKKATIMVFTYESADCYGFVMWSRRGTIIKGCYVICEKEGEPQEAGSAESLSGQEPVIQEVDNPETLRVQMKEASGSGVTTTSFECNVCQLAVELVIGFGCGAGAALIASAACGPGALLCAFIVASVQAAICELLFFPVSREAVCRGLGYC
jgi:hypothetical protein